MQVNNTDSISIISKATKNNWDKLGTKIENRLTSRANKKLSEKHIIPKEYFTNSNNIRWIQNFLSNLSASWQIESIILSAAKNLLYKKKLLHKWHVQGVLSQYDYPIIDGILNNEFPTDEHDILGIIYQCLLTEGEKNITGAYYTPYHITTSMTKECVFSNNQKFLDPCCGTGSFLLSIENAHPTQLYGIDCNPIAVMIAKINLLLKYDNCEFIPNIVCSNFLDDGLFCNHQAYLVHKYDYIITNPPWGASNHLQSTDKVQTESFSQFFVEAYKLLNNNGFIRFLFPESILNVKTHYKFRKFILENTDLQQITYYTTTFNGVLSKIVDICSVKKDISRIVRIVKNNKLITIPKSNFSKTESLVFHSMNEMDISIVEQVRLYANHTLKDSIWALGVVTGDNKKKVLEQCTDGSEPIYTGKDVQPFSLKEPSKFIVYHREQMQQVANEEYYRAQEKLVYKFISDKLVFAYDNTKRLCLNSANILIPHIPNMHIKTVLAFLNSTMYQYLYATLFSEIKILKGNLMELPFPTLTKEQDIEITQIVDKILEGDNMQIPVLNGIIFQFFNLANNQIQYIEQGLWKN